MRWITDDEEFKKLMLDARRCVYTDSGRHKTELQRLQFADGFFGSKDWSHLLRTLMEWSRLEKIYFTVLDPDPEEFFHRRYGMYPCFELEKADFPANFIEALNKPYGNQPGEVLLIVRFEFTVTSPSMPWFVHALQSNADNGGHLWVVGRRKFSSLVETSWKPVKTDNSCICYAPRLAGGPKSNRPLCGVLPFAGRPIAQTVHGVVIGRPFGDFQSW